MLYNLSNSYPPPAAHGVRLLLSSFYSPPDKALCPLPRPSPQPLPGRRPAHPRSRGRRRRPAGGNRAYQARSLRATYWSKRRSSCLMNSIIPLAKRASSFILGSVVLILLKWGAAPTKASM